MKAQEITDPSASCPGELDLLEAVATRAAHRPAHAGVGGAGPAGEKLGARFVCTQIVVETG